MVARLLATVLSHLFLGAVFLQYLVQQLIHPQHVLVTVQAGLILNLAQGGFDLAQSLLPLTDEISLRLSAAHVET